MKKKMNLLAITMVLIGCIGFSSCNKPEFNPERKISKIYDSYKMQLWRGDSLMYSNENSKNLSMIWRWEKNKLMTISWDMWDIYFVYDKNQVTKMEMGDEECVFKYNKDKKRESAEVRENGELILSIKYAYSGDKVSTMTCTIYDGYKSDNKDFADKYKAMSRFLLPESVNNQILAHKMKEKKEKNTKADNYTFEYHFTYAGNNVSQLKMVDLEDGYIETYSFKYDSKKNPFYCSLSPYIADFFEASFSIGYSENNIIAIYDEDGDLGESYSYVYDGDWPTQQIDKYEYSFETYDYETGGTILVREISESTTHYEYLK